MSPARQLAYPTSCYNHLQILTVSYSLFTTTHSCTGSISVGVRSSSNSPRELQMKYIKNKWVVITVLIAAIGMLTAFKLQTGKAPQYTTAKIQQGDIQNVVQATGSITAVTTVQVGSQVSG